MRFDSGRRSVFAWLAISLVACTFFPGQTKVDGAPSVRPDLSLTTGPLSSHTEPLELTETPNLVGRPTVTPKPTETSSQSMPPRVGLLVGNTAPDFALTYLQGQNSRLSDFRGRAVMINFWAVWCGPCRFELPVMQTVYEANRDKGFVVLAIHMRGYPEQVREFAEDLEMTFPVLLDRGGRVTAEYQVRGLPTSFFIDQDGVILGVEIGPVDEGWLEHYLAQAGVE